MHVAPFAHLFRTFYIIVGHIHSSRVSHIAVDDDNLAVVAGEDMVYPWKSHRVELVYLDAVVTQFLYVRTL